MPFFSLRSRRQLNTCDDRLVQLFTHVVRQYDCTILEGHRDEERQNELYRQGLSKLRWPFGRHNTTPSEAVDVAPYPIDWQDTERFYHFSGYVQGQANALRIPIRWGGDWDRDYDLNDQTFYDLVHFELITVDPSADRPLLA